MGKSKENHLLNHFQNPAFRDEPCRLVFPNSRKDRLALTYVVDPGDWHEVTRIVSNSVNFRTTWFPDANVAIKDETGPVWEALRVAALGSSASSTMFTGVVRHELQD